METREEIKHFLSIFIVGVPWEKKINKVYEGLFYFSFRERERVKEQREERQP